MKALTALQMRNTDQTVIGCGISSGFHLMTRAGNAAEKEIRRFAGSLTLPGKTQFHILAGPGNNGGDGFIIAAGLANDFPVVLHCTVPPEKLHGDALLAFQALPDAVKNTVRHDFSADEAGDSAVIIDCMLGTGISGPPREPVGAWIAEVNRSRRPVVSIDIPSGLNADDGSAPGGAVRAALTLTLAAPKTGLLTAPGYCGRLKVVDIGIPAPFIERFAAAPDVTDTNAVRALIRRESPDTYKQLRGRVLIAGGSADYPSAPFLSAEAALRAGAGLVTAAVPASALIVCSVPKALIVRRIEDSGSGCFSAASFEMLAGIAGNADAVAVGPGMTVHSSGFFRDFLMLLKKSGTPAVFDADALNLLARMPDLLGHLPAGSVLTPHAGEMHRLLSALGIEDSGMPSMEKARKLAVSAHACVVMKGPFSAVCAADAEQSAFNLSGSPALATAGSGDVLTGIAAAFLAKGYSAYDAARIAVHLHGLAGELAPEAVGNGTPDPAFPSGVIADDLPGVLPRALRMLLSC